MKMRIELERPMTVHRRRVEIFAEGVYQGEIRDDRR